MEDYFFLKPSTYILTNNRYCSVSTHFYRQFVVVADIVVDLSVFVETAFADQQTSLSIYVFRDRRQSSVFFFDQSEPFAVGSMSFEGTMINVDQLFVQRVVSFHQHLALVHFFIHFVLRKTAVGFVRVALVFDATTVSGL